MSVVAGRSSIPRSASHRSTSPEQKHGGSGASCRSSASIISVGYLSASEIIGTPQYWAKNGPMMGLCKIEDVVFDPGATDMADKVRLIGTYKSLRTSASQGNFHLAPDRAVLSRLLNTLRLPSSFLGVSDIQSKATRDFEEAYPWYISNGDGNVLQSATSVRPLRTTSQTSLSAIPGTFEWCSKQPTVWTPIIRLDWTRNAPTFSVITEDGTFTWKQFTPDDVKVLFHVGNLYLLAEYRGAGEKIKARFLKKYSSVSYNEGSARLIPRPVDVAARLGL